MKWTFRTATAVLLLLIVSEVGAAENAVTAFAERFALEQARDLPGEVSVRASALDPQTRLAPCTSLQGFLPQGSRLWGKTMIGVRCQEPVRWSILIPVHVAVTGNYIYLTRPMGAGQTIQATDIAIGKADLTSLATGTLNTPAAIIGKTLKNSLAAGQPLRAEQLNAPLLVRQGQTVRLIARGNGFTATSEGKALNNGAEGQIIQIKAASGQTLSGTVLGDGQIEIIR